MNLQMDSFTIWCQSSREPKSSLHPLAGQGKSTASASRLSSVVEPEIDWLLVRVS